MKIRTEILAIIASGEFDGRSFRITAGQLDRKVYQEVAKVVDAVGGKWDKRAKALVFDGDAAEALEPLLLTGEVIRTRQEFGQFDTPPALAAIVVDGSGLRPGMKVYEPSAGIGNLVAAVIERIGTGANVFGNEIDPKRHAACLSRNFRAFGAGGLSMRDFRTIDPNPVFDIILMNPPFAMRADIAHVSHAARFLAPGGRLTAIMSAGVMFREDRKAIAFRAMVEARGGEMDMLPEDSFKASGTGVNTCLVQFGG